MTSFLAAELIFSNLSQALPALILLLISAVLLWYNYRNSYLPPRRKGMAMTLKGLGFALLAFCFLEPVWTSKTIKPGSNIFVQIADNSMGMQVTDRGVSQTRAEYLKELVHGKEQPKWQKIIEEDFQLRNYQIDSRLQRVSDFSGLTFTGESSAIANGLRLIQERFNAKPLAGILLFTDGNLTDLPSDPAWMEQLPPVFPIIIGGETPPPDAGISAVTISETVFEDAPITIGTEIHTTDLNGEEITVQIIDSEDHVVDENIFTPDGKHALHRVEFRIKPASMGIEKYRVHIQPSAGEATLINNQHAITIDRGGGPYRILYVCGRPNWEYKFLRRSLAEDDQVDLVGLIRMAKREPKFDFRGRSGETSNPLFRGFADGSDEDSEQYDQAVLIRMNTRDEKELIGGFPKTAEDLFEFQGIIIDDLEAEFFSPDQMALIERFVSFRGGGLLMLGGQESYHQGGYEKTPIGKLLPVYVDRLTERPDYRPMYMNFTREGYLQPWIRLRETEDLEQDRINAMPAFSVLNRLPAIKPGASVIAEVNDGDGKMYPAIAVQRYGNGQAAAITIGDIWRWGFENEEQHEDMARSWRQTLRWLIKDTPRRVSLSVDTEQGSNQPCILHIRIRNKDYEPMDDARVSCAIETPDGTTVELSAVPVDEERGLYVCHYLPPASGHYTAIATVKAQGGLAWGTDRTGWSINRSTTEFESIVPNRSLMEELARVTGGEVIDASQLESFAQKLDQREMPVMETWSRPAWHTPLLFLIALSCFVGEWGIRRKGGAM